MGKRLDLWRLAPFSHQFGGDRGTPIDRYFIDRFLADHAGDIHGRVLEFGDDIYTRRHGGRHVRRSDVLYPKAGKPGVTIVADLADGRGLPSRAFDCVICTQTLQYLFDLPAAVGTLHRILKPGGVVLATVPGIAQIDSGGVGQGWSDCWRPTRHATLRLFAAAFGAEQVAVTAQGNALLGAAFLMGVTLHELPETALEHRDPDYDVSIAVRATRGPVTAARIRPPPRTAALSTARFTVAAGDLEQVRDAAAHTAHVSLAVATPARVAPARLQGRIAADSWGFITALSAEIDGGAGGAPDGCRAALEAAGPYYCPTVRLVAEGATGAAAALLHESLVEALARARGEDGWQLRHRNALRFGLPTASGHWLSASAGLRPCLEALKPAYDHLRRAQGGTRAGRRGVGLACVAIGLGAPFQDQVASAHLSLEAGGALILATDAADALERRALAAIVAPLLGRDARAITVPAGAPALGNTLFARGRAAWLAANDLRARLRAAAGAPAPAALVWSRAGPRFHQGAREWAPPVAAYQGEGRFVAATTGPDAEGQGTPYPAYLFAAAMVAVTVARGRARVAHLEIAADVGRALLPAAQRRRLADAAADAVQGALGVPPRARPVCHLIEDPEPRGGRGVKALGVEAAAAVTPALLNAINAALARPLTTWPPTAAALAD